MSQVQILNQSGATVSIDAAKLPAAMAVVERKLAAYHNDIRIAATDRSMSDAGRAAHIAQLRNIVAALVAMQQSIQAAMGV